MKRAGFQTAILSLLLSFTACTEDRADLNAVKARPAIGSPLALKTPEGFSNARVGIDGATREPIARTGLSGGAGVDQGERRDVPNDMPGLRVAASRLSGYTVSFANETMWLGYRQTGYNALWIDPGYWGYEIVKIEGKEVASLGRVESMHLLRTLPEPMHLIIRSRAGSIREVEAVTHVDP